jgi:hypothetical protein
MLCPTVPDVLWPQVRLMGRCFRRCVWQTEERGYFVVNDLLAAFLPAATASPDKVGDDIGTDGGGGGGNCGGRGGSSPSGGGDVPESAAGMAPAGAAPVAAVASTAEVGSGASSLTNSASHAHISASPPTSSLSLRPSSPAALDDISGRDDVSVRMPPPPALQAAGGEGTMRQTPQA